MIDFLTVVLIVGSNVLYHCCQKSLSKMESPLFLLGGAYLLSFAITAGLGLAVEGGRPGLRHLSASPWPFIGLAVACVGIEGGFLLAYKQGWKLGILSASVGSISCITLLVVAATWSGQKISPTALAGMVASILGVALIQISK